jgi:hypothetical protein
MSLFVDSVLKLGEQTHTVAEKAGVSALLVLVEQVQQCQPEIGHRRGPLCGASTRHWNHAVAAFVKAAPDLHHDSRHNSTLIGTKEENAVAFVILGLRDRRYGGGL